MHISTGNQPIERTAPLPLIGSRYAAEAATKGRQTLAPVTSTFERFVEGVLHVRFWATSSAAFQALSLELWLVELGLTDPRVHTNLFLDQCLLVEEPPLVDRLAVG